MKRSSHATAAPLDRDGTRLRHAVLQSNFADGRRPPAGLHHRAPGYDSRGGRAPAPAPARTNASPARCSRRGVNPAAAEQAGREASGPDIITVVTVACLPHLQHTRNAENGWVNDGLGRKRINERRINNVMMAKSRRSTQRTSQ